MSATETEDIVATRAASRTSRAAATPNQRRGTFLKWLRKTHSWIGLWGAALGLLFGVTGVLLNHRAIMKIPAAQVQESSVQLPLPNPAPENPKAMADWLQRELGFDKPANRVRGEPSHPVGWGDRTVKQPERWSAVFSTPRINAQAEYWVGNSFVNIKRSENNVFGLLNNLHKGSGLGVAWILLVDTLAGGMVLLSITGVLLWAGMNKRRMAGAAIGMTSLVLGVVFAMQSM
jgi:hypothetical protein